MSSSKFVGRNCSGFTGILMLLLVICLVDCATGSCLSYGHSCWGAHGKRSGNSLSSAPDWYLTRILRRMAANSELTPPSIDEFINLQNRARQANAKDDDVADIYRLAVADDASPIGDLTDTNVVTPIELRSRFPEAKPMLDDNLLGKMKIWQLMKQASEEK